jgi:hypothetical protein
VTPNAAPYCVAPETSRATPVIGTLAAPFAFVTDGMSIATVPAGAVGAPPLVGKVIVVEGAGLPPRGGERRAVGGDVDVPGVAGRLLEVVGQRDFVALHVVDGLRGRVVVGRRVGEVDRRAGARQRHPGAGVEVHLHLDPVVTCGVMPAVGICSAVAAPGMMCRWRRRGSPSAGCPGC